MIAFILKILFFVFFALVLFQACIFLVLITPLLFLRNLLVKLELEQDKKIF